MTRLYAIGPVTGRLMRNIYTFNDARKSLKDAGYETVDIPHTFIGCNAEHDEAMARSINRLTGFWFNDRQGFIRYYDGVALLPGWEQSEGARTEKLVAEACGIPCKPVNEWIEEAR